MKRVLVTGGAGFIGSNFVCHLLARDQAVEVITLDALTYAGSTANLDDLPDPSRHQFVKGDIANFELVTYLMRDGQVDTVVHFAAESHVDRSIAGPDIFVRTNVLGTQSLLEASRAAWAAHNRPRSCRFHHVSTDEVYGSLGASDPPFTEETRYAPNSPYSATKAASDHLVRAYWKTYELPVTITNCSNNYGPRQHQEKLIPTVVRACLDGKSIPVYGNGSNVRDWLYVDDHCDGVLSALENGKAGEVYNIGGHCEVANIDLVKMICSAMDKQEPGKAPHARLIDFVKDRPGHDWRYAIDVGKTKRELGWAPSTSLGEGIAKTISWITRASR